MTYPFHQPDLFANQCDYSRANRYNTVQRLATAISSKPYCTSNFSHGLVIRPKFTAIECPSIQINTPWEVRYIILDVDKPLDFPNWPINPSLIALNPENGHYHVYFELETPVLIGEKVNPRPQAYLKSIIKKLINAFDADPDYSGLIAKNPLHRKWQIAPYKGRWTTYSLKRLEKALSCFPQAVKSNLAPNINGRNCTVFDSLRFWSYRQIQTFESPLNWDTHVLDKCLSLNQILTEPLNDREAFQIAKSVSKWTWNNRNKLNGSFRHRGAMGYGMTRHNSKEAPYLDKDTTQARRQAAAERTNKMRRLATEDKIISAIGNLTAKGQRVSMRAVSKLAAIDHKTISRYYPHLMP